MNIICSIQNEDNKEIKFNNLEELKNIIYKNIKDIKITKESIENIYDLSSYIYLDGSHEIFIDYDYHDHNLLNKTYGKKSVPTICQNGHMFNNIMYCPHCKKIHKDIDYSGTIFIADEDQEYLRHKAQVERIDTFTCLNCNSTYSIDEVKLIDGRIEYICGDVFIDENKISLAYKYLYNSINRHGNFYYEDGYVKLTLNTKTGYSYTTNKGHAYKTLKRLWEKYDKVPPVTFNSTYTFSDGTEGIIHDIIKCKAMDRYRNLSKEELLEEFKKDNKKTYYKSLKEEEISLIEYISNELYNKVQENFNYKLPEYIKKAKRDHISDASRTFKNFNRYVNLKPSHSIMNILINKEYDFKKNKINREEVNLINGLFKVEGIKLGKKTRAIVQQDLYNQRLFDLLPIALCFKNPSNINKIINTILVTSSNDLYYNFSYYSRDIADAIRIWLNFRDENYIVARLIEEMQEKRPDHVVPMRKKTTKLNLIKDSFYMIRNIKRYIEDFNVEEFITFKNEKQFHDDLSRFINSDEYHDLVERKQASIVFKLEKDIFDLENKDNNIFIARNNGELQKIGRQMNICVGGYTGLVEKGNCRIVYIMDNENKEYKACLELRGYTNKNKTEYSLVQAKLKYNRRPCEDMDIYNKILKWTDDNKIKVDTYDMELPQEKLKDVIRAI